MKLHVVPMSLRAANDFVQDFHRHNTRTQRDGGKFAIGASDGDELWGIAIAGRPLARTLDDGMTIEVTMACTRDGLHTGWRAEGDMQLSLWPLLAHLAGHGRRAHGDVHPPVRKRREPARRWPAHRRGVGAEARRGMGRPGPIPCVARSVRRAQAAVGDHGMTAYLTSPGGRAPDAPIAFVEELGPRAPQWIHDAVLDASYRVAEGAFYRTRPWPFDVRRVFQRMAFEARQLGAGT
jgi:hypothetical protein